MSPLHLRCGSVSPERVAEKSAHVEESIIGCGPRRSSLNPKRSVECIYYECSSACHSIADTAARRECTAARPESRFIQPVFYRRVDLEDAIYEVPCDRYVGNQPRHAGNLAGDLKLHSRITEAGLVL